MSNVDWSGKVVDVIGIAIGDRGHSCEEHDICGCVLLPDILVRFVKEEIMVEGKIEVMISVFGVTDSVERCRVGFLPCFLVPSANDLNGILMQVSEVFDELHSLVTIKIKVHHNHLYRHYYLTVLSAWMNGEMEHNKLRPPPSRLHRPT